MAAPKVNLRQIKRKSGITYVLDYAVNGQRHRESVGKNKRLAEQVAAKMQVDLIQGQYGLIPSQNKRIKLEDLAEEFLESKRNIIRPDSLKRYENALTPFLDYFQKYFPGASNDIRLIKGKYIKACLDHLLKEGVDGKTWEKKTINYTRSTVASVFRYALLQEYIRKNPVTETQKYKISDKRTDLYYTDRELGQIWAIIDKYWIDPLKFIVNTGLRSGEMANLKWIDVNLNGDPPYIEIISSDDWRTKTGNSWKIPLNPGAQEIIERWRGRHPKFVFISKRGNKINPRSPLSVLKTALRKLGLEGDVHKLRHTFASRLRMEGVPLDVIAELLGHRDIASTQIYAHLSQEHLKSAVDKWE